MVEAENEGNVMKIMITNAIARRRVLHQLKDCDDIG